MVDFTALIGELGRKLAWDISLAAMPASGKPPEKELHPLSPSTEDSGRASQNTVSLGGFLDKLNTMNKSRRLR